MSPLITTQQLMADFNAYTIVDCRFDLSDPAAGERSYRESHIVGAHYLDLEQDLSAPAGRHGGRHPLPAPETFVGRLAAMGINANNRVVAYDESRFCYAARLRWMMMALGLPQVQILDGGYAAWCADNGATDDRLPEPMPVTAACVDSYIGIKTVDDVRQATGNAGSLLIDSRDPRRFAGIEEPIDPVAGHIPGACNLPWQGVSNELGFALAPEAQRERLQGIAPDAKAIVYCGSGVSACVNLLGFELAGRPRPALYAGSWSDWCSYL